MELKRVWWRFVNWNGFNRFLESLWYNRSWNLTAKLEAIWFWKAAIKWLRSFLSKWILLVNIESKLSDIGKMYCGVPQGSTLGFHLFLIYVSDMPQAVTLSLLLYEDDSCILYQHKEVDEIEKQLNKDFKNIFDWFVDNNQSMHFGKNKTSRYFL